MYLKSVEIVGFKSFADKTGIDLKPGITGIVGPNGCGKSNVMEAVRWCIGEMSWKSLRSPSMVDVIFAGNAKRSPMGMAEVTLTFDNSSNQLPIDYTEITVTRRIFRSGESEYFLNKTACRLRDIRELFLDTGIGGDGYAIIDQGGVDFVLNSKPEDRRSLFEEAAGVSKYRAKREEALRKLEKVEADLNRLQDSISLINDQIKKLDSDARKAKLYQKYQDELTAQEAAQILQETKSVASELERGEALVAPVQENLNNRQVELDAEQGRHAAARLELTQEQVRVGEIQQQIAAARAEIGRLEERIKNGQEMLVQLSQRKSAAEEELKSDESRLAGMDSQITQARLAVEQAAQSLDTAKRDRDGFLGQLAELQREVEAAQQDGDAAKKRTLAAMQASVDASNRFLEVEKDSRDVQLQLRQIQRDLGKNETQTESARRDLEALLGEILEQQTWLESTQGSLAGKQAARREIDTESAALTAETVRLRVESESLKARIELLENQGAQDPYWVGAQAVAGAGIAGIFGTLRSLIQVAGGFETAVEDALGERLYSVLCEDVAAAQAGIDFLAEGEKGRARFLVLSSFPAGPEGEEYPSQAKPLLDAVRYDDRFSSAIRYLMAECYLLDKKSFGRHWVCGGATAAREAVSLNLSDVKALRERTVSLEQSQKDVVQRQADLEARRLRLDEEIRCLVAVEREESNRWTALGTRREQGQERLRALEQETALLRQESDHLTTDISVAEKELGELRASLDSLRAQESDARSTESAAIERCGAAQANFNARKTQQGHLDQVVSQWETQFQLFEKQLNAVASEEERLRADIGRRGGEIRELENRAADVVRIEGESRDRLDGHHSQLAEHETAAQSMGAQLQTLTLSVEKMEESIQSLLSECERHRDELHQWEVQASGLKSRQDSLKGRLWDAWQLTLEDASAKYGEVAVDSEKIQTLRRRIQGMGNINLAAPEEYEQLSSKHQFLLTQVADLNQAKEDLRAAISKINATTREHFRQTFTEVRDHFRRLYGMLFEGGEADLVLTDPENLLETGVEIVAQPPGKRLQSITLLSGGERTMTAIALLFSFFMVKPSPVCMLDEADAALDEANVTRFVSMLRDFAGKSQFLIISHNKRTMEAADMIYGVTMEESGVTQLLAVDFKKKAGSMETPHAPPDSLSLEGKN